MASAEVYDVIEQRLAGMLAGTTCVYENEDWPLQDNPQTWVYVEIFGDVYAQASIGADANNLIRENGQFLAHVMVPTGTGSRAARVLAKQIVDLFVGQDIGGVIFARATIGAGDPGRASGNYFAMTAAVDWQLDR